MGTSLNIDDESEKKGSLCVDCKLSDVDRESS